MKKRFIAIQLRVLKLPACSLDSSLAALPISRALAVAVEPGADSMLVRRIVERWPNVFHREQLWLVAGKSGHRQHSREQWRGHWDD